MASFFQDIDDYKQFNIIKSFNIKNPFPFFLFLHHDKINCDKLDEFIIHETINKFILKIPSLQFLLTTSVVGIKFENCLKEWKEIFDLEDNFKKPTYITPMHDFGILTINELYSLHCLAYSNDIQICFVFSINGAIYCQPIGVLNTNNRILISCFHKKIEKLVDINEINYALMKSIPEPQNRIELPVFSTIVPKYRANEYVKYIFLRWRLSTSKDSEVFIQDRGFFKHLTKYIENDKNRNEILNKVPLYLKGTSLETGNEVYVTNDEPFIEEKDESKYNQTKRLLNELQLAENAELVNDKLVECKKTCIFEIENEITNETDLYSKNVILEIDRSRKSQIQSASFITLNDLLYTSLDEKEYSLFKTKEGKTIAVYIEKEEIEDENELYNGVEDKNENEYDENDNKDNEYSYDNYENEYDDNENEYDNDDYEEDENEYDNDYDEEDEVSYKDAKKEKDVEVVLKALEVSDVQINFKCLAKFCYKHVFYSSTISKEISSFSNVFISAKKYFGFAYEALMSNKTDNKAILIGSDSNSYEKMIEQVDKSFKTSFSNIQNLGIFSQIINGKNVICVCEPVNNVIHLINAVDMIKDKSNKFCFIFTSKVEEKLSEFILFNPSEETLIDDKYSVEFDMVAKVLAYYATFVRFSFLNFEICCYLRNLLDT
ncbi:hypothetical protein TVAG_436970 [Trichomonas vaginalis G3]|uniref:Uncharacterized protein n=1 Tax=Trichomonas vaginalis (strain ATCC PRA-98 / G3) TaxID=412133 RepID=A2DFE5_TRIV3|nr:hypothetical protein TVAGG3_0565180 [Trichomonas vaginalis G3]EAY20873.1 hypothetical protein TVAG_436970 [Trichomonas vaginalis G3]KAI5521517.1 hypothetical protein TVAGG3_0565180 [Trichomonas vaginalis G3]|eukprot:XP_001581859.1 hypothetical protein [Trichomonas vaginalis G3]